MAKITKPTKSVKEILDAEPKVKIIIPSTPGLKPAEDIHVVRINGYGYKIMAGQYVEVPKTVADILVNSQKGIAEVNANYADMTIGGGRNLTDPDAGAGDKAAEE
ncbi:MAG: hypothetical protein IKU32_02250 [Clostridia bacterium]|nr:hypothetical protein [Clostridia bacterium]